MTSQEMKDRAVRFAVMLERLKSGEVKEFETALDKASRELNRMFSELGQLGEATRREAEKLISEFRREMVKIESEEMARHLDRMTELVAETGDFLTEMVKSAAGDNFTPGLRQFDARKAMSKVLNMPLDMDGSLLEPFLKGESEKYAREVSNLVRQAWSDGLTNDEAVRRLLGTKSRRYKDGEMARIRRKMATTIRTSTTHVNSAAQQVFYAENDDVVDGYRWVSTLDGSTSPICRSLDGRVYKIDDKKAPRPPVHPNCRSTTVPDLNDEFDWLSEGATRSSNNGPVDESETYYSWLKRQPKNFQDDVLGKKRGQLFRQGGLNADEFARLNLGRNFEPLTLQEMKQRKPLVFEKADVTL